jgi:hypothetical protein
MNSKQCKLCINSSLDIDTRFLWKVQFVELILFTDKQIMT